MSYKHQLGAMSPSDRDTNEASPKKKIKWYTAILIKMKRFTGCMSTWLRNCMLTKRNI